MAQAGVEWDRKTAQQVRRQGSRDAPRGQERPRTRPAGSVAGPTVGQGDWMPLSALLAAVMLGLLGYFIGELSLAAFPHPMHWLGIIAGASLGYVGGLVWNRVRGF